MPTLLKAPLIRMLRWRAVGFPAAATAHRLGARTISRKISGLCDYVPPIVSVFLPARYSPPRELRMYGHRGRDSVARSLWHGGWGGFEPPMPDLFAALSQNARWVLDVGSYSGFYTLVATAVSPTVRVLAFDPFPAAQQLFEANVQLNGIGDRVRLMRAAASDKPGTAPLYVPPTDTGLIETASSLGPWHRSKHMQVLQVPVVTLDAAVEEAGAGPVDLMKIDVESLEDYVLRGAVKILQEHRPFVFLEALAGYDYGPLEKTRCQYDYISAVLGDQGLLWLQHVEAHASFPNQIFCPREKIEPLKQIAAEVFAKP